MREKSKKREYLRTYSICKNSLLLLAKDGKKVVGAITGIPLEEAQSSFRRIFFKNRIPVSDVYYLGEIILLKEYRKGGIGALLYDHFEQLVREKALYTSIAIAEVVKDGKDPQKPKDYIPLDEFWEKREFVKYPALKVHISWKKVGESKKTRHALIFLLKNLK